MTFTFYGPITSNNRVSRRVGRRTIANPEATRDKQTVYQLAYAAAREAKWVLSPACAVWIVAHNTRLDADNVCKVALDGMIGAVYNDDASVTELHVLKIRDNGGQRYVVSVEPRAALEKPKKPRAVREKAKAR